MRGVEKGQKQEQAIYILRKNEGMRQTALSSYTTATVRSAHKGSRTLYQEY